MINGNYNINNLRGNYLSLYYLIVYVCLHTFSQNNNHRKRSPSQVSLCSLFLLQYHSSTKPCFFLAISILLSANVSVVNIKFCSSPFYFNQIMLILGINLMVFKISYLPLFGQIQWIQTFILIKDKKNKTLIFNKKKTIKVDIN